MIELPPDLAAVQEEHRLAYARGDADAIADLCTEDCVLLTQGGPALNGRETVRELFRSLYAAGSLTYEQNLVRAEVCDTLAVLTLEVDLEMREAILDPVLAPTDSVGELAPVLVPTGILHLLSMYVWRMEDGVWRLAQRMSMTR